VAYFTDNAADVFYHDEPPEVRAMLFSKLRPQAIASVMTPATACGWWYVPPTYVFTTQGISVPLTTQKIIVDSVRRTGEVEKGGMRAFDGPLGEASIDCGHCAPFVRKVDEMVEILIKCCQDP
jgi:hypothetical protein